MYTTVRLEIIANGKVIRDIPFQMQTDSKESLKKDLMSLVVCDDLVIHYKDE